MIFNKKKGSNEENDSEQNENDEASQEQSDEAQQLEDQQPEEVIKEEEEEEEEKPAESPKPRPKPQKNYKLALSYSNDGVYMSLSAKGQLTPEDHQKILLHLLRKEIRSIDKMAVQGAIASNKDMPVVIAPPQNENIYDESFTVSIENNHMSAYLTLLPPEEDKGKRLDAEQVLTELVTAHQLRYGIKRDVIERMLNEEIYDEKTLIAQGLEPVPGEDGSLIFHFDHERTSDAGALRKVADNEKVDYKNLDLFERVEKDQLLVTKVPPKEGIPGRTVYDKPVSPSSGKLYNLPVGKNTYVSEDKLNMYAKESGRVDYINNYVEVSNCYMIEGDVDISTGNIDFLGDVCVLGNVRSDFIVKATGNIEVHGIVESATLQSEKDIIIQGGVQGAGKGALTAGGGIFARFVEYATVQASDIVVAESLLHSNVNCFGPIEVLNGSGSIIGGNVCAGTYIAARFLGNSSGRGTQIEVGVSPAHRAELLNVEETIAALRDVVNKLQRIVELPATPNQTQRQKDARIEAMRKLLIQKKVLDDSIVVYNNLMAQLEEMRDGQVHVLVSAYPGVVISIGYDRYSISDNISYATFKMDNNLIGFTSCLFKQSQARIKRIKKR